MKRKIPCFFCQKNNVFCTGERPCAQCKLTGKEKACFDLQPNGKRPATPLSLNVTSLASIASLLNTPANSKKSPTSNSNFSTGASFATTASSSNYSSVLNTQTAFHATVSPTSSSNMTKPTFTPKISMVHAPLSEAKDRLMNDINVFLLNELRQYKSEVDTLKEELINLKKENESLSNKLKNAEQSNFQRSFSSAINFLFSKSTEPVKSNLLASQKLINQSTEKPMVVFDLTKGPATVMTANDAFCKFLGYTMNEVNGASWQKFVHPEYIEKALNIFGSRKNTSNVIEFDLVYRAKDGTLYHTLDTHTIFSGPDGSKLSDVVSITLLDNQLPLSNPLSKMNGSMSSFYKPNEIKNSLSLFEETEDFDSATTVKPSEVSQPSYGGSVSTTNSWNSLNGVQPIEGKNSAELSVNLNSTPLVTAKESSIEFNSNSNNSLTSQPEGVPFLTVDTHLPYPDQAIIPSNHSSLYPLNGTESTEVLSDDSNFLPFLMPEECDVNGGLILDTGSLAILGGSSTVAEMANMNILELESGNSSNLIAPSSPSLWAPLTESWEEKNCAAESIVNNGMPTQAELPGESSEQSSY
eukprot:TRINITY_DN839_c0_g1_i1.p1 TRINITY_DN839_c0_g1~~TRINITY_DN839_c0_g1_i1.p1  ORF type:complete len:607 (+),score=108.15 TRINITY_DN839_c0_g1_i1:76-1821(+)